MNVPSPAPWLLVAALFPSLPLQSGELLFRRHDINTDSTYSACAVFDVNRDGLLDVFCGAWWYEAPDWKRRFVGEVEIIRGRYDGYAHLPYDVNRDEWLDVIHVNYRSASIYWLAHPGPKPHPWAKRLVAEPGPAETGRLYDIDGDGRLDLLPNGVRSAAWWEMIEVPGQKELNWVRHDLPVEVAGHGVGFGDVNGDGRGDVVGPRGWVEAPADPRKGSWTWRPEFELDRDASVPIYIEDVDGDGDNDIIWGRGHNYGISWLEQQQEGGGRVWKRHLIDDSWSQAHSPLWIDLDQNGQMEFVVGKRYWAHDGRDPGARDPLVIYRYEYDRAAARWQRHAIQTSGPAGFGLDPKAVDLDGDGDLDLVTPGRSGLYWFENLLKSKPAGP